MAWLFWNEVGRKLIHISILIVLWAYVLIEQAYNRQIALVALVLLLIIFLIFEYFRLELGWRMPFFSQFIRPKEEHRMYGVIYFLSATVICLAVFDYKIALAALLMTTFGDMVAALAGKKWGETILFKNKTIVGFNAELLVNFIVGFIVLHSLPASIYIIIGMAITATAVETLVDELDDNLLIPLFAGFVGQLILYSL
jgi:phytol kinase